MERLLNERFNPRVILIFEQRKQDGVCSLAHYIDHVVVRVADNNGHSLASRVKAEHVEQLVLDLLVVYRYVDVVIFISALKGHSKESRTVNESKLIRRGRVVMQFTVLDRDQDAMVER